MVVANGEWRNGEMAKLIRAMDWYCCTAVKSRRRVAALPAAAGFDSHFTRPPQFDSVGQLLRGAPRAHRIPMETI